MRIKSILGLPFVKALLYVNDKGEVRYTELSRLIHSRGTLSLVLDELEEDSLLQRKVITTKPIQAIYSLTELGKDVDSAFALIKTRMNDSRTK